MNGRRQEILATLENAGMGALTALVGLYAYGLLWSILDPVQSGGCWGTGGSLHTTVNYVIRPGLLCVAFGPLAMSMGSLSALWFRASRLPLWRQVAVACAGWLTASAGGTFVVTYVTPCYLLGRWTPAAPALLDCLSFGITIAAFALPWFVVAGWMHRRSFEQTA